MSDKITAFVEEGCRIEGNLSFEGTVRIAGDFKGDVFTNDTFIVTETGVVEANIKAGVVVVYGTVKGNIEATGRVEMKKPARFEGAVISPNLVVEEGVIFHGETRINEG